VSHSVNHEIADCAPFWRVDELELTGNEHIELDRIDGRTRP